MHSKKVKQSAHAPICLTVMLFRPTEAIAPAFNTILYVTVLNLRSTSTTRNVISGAWPGRASTDCEYHASRGIARIHAFGTRYIRPPTITPGATSAAAAAVALPSAADAAADAAGEE